MEIYITTKNVFGNDLFYVKDKLAAKVVSQLTGRKTVSRLDIENLSFLGVKVKVSEEAQESLGLLSLVAMLDWANERAKQ